MKPIQGSMRRLVRLTVAAIALAAALAPVAAENLTLDAARKMALANSRSLAKATLSADSATLDEKKQLYNSLPSLSLGASARTSVPPSAGKSALDSISASVSAGASYNVWDGGKNITLAAIDKIATSSAREAARAEYFSVLSSVDSAWYALLEARASLDAAKASMEVSDVNLSIAKVKYESGAISTTDYLSAESGAESNRTQLSQAERNVAVSGAKLASILGVAPLPTVEPVDFSAYDALIAKIAAYGDADIDAFVAKLGAAAIAGNPALARAALAKERSGKSVQLAMAGFSPTVSASVSTGLTLLPVSSGSSSGGTSSGSSTPSLSISLSANVPVDFWKTQADVESASLSAKQAALDYESSLQSTDIDVRTAVYDCVSNARAVLSSSKALDYAEKVLENKQELYKLSSASVSDVSNAASLVSSNTRALITARYNFLSGISTIRSLAALESDDDVRNLIP